MLCLKTENLFHNFIPPSEEKKENSMKKFFSLILALIMMLSLAACGEKAETPDADASVGTADEPVVPLQRKSVKILMFGDALICGNNMGDVLYAFAESDGIDLNVTPIVFNNTSRTATYNLYELCEFDLNNEATGFLSSLNAKNMEKALNEGGFDIFLTVSGRDRTLSVPEITVQNTSAFAMIERKLAENSPGCKTVLFIPPTFREGCQCFSFGTWDLSKAGAGDPESHKRAIAAYADELRSKITGESASVDISAAFDFFDKDYAQTGIDIFYDDLRAPSAAGSYYIACVLYASLFGKSPLYKTEYGFLDADEATILQEAAHRFVFGTDPVAFVPEKLVYETKQLFPADERYANETYPEHFDVLSAALWEYYSRGTLIQYDQLSSERVNFTRARRTTENGAPEQASPQHLLFLDCSSFAYSVYSECFGYTFCGYNRSKTFALNLEEGVVFDWSFAKSDLSPDEASELFAKTLQPGDVISYSDPPNTVGHTMIYIGNGTLMHCVGKHISGGGGDYVYKYFYDLHEVGHGALALDPVDILLEKDSPRYEFRDDLEIKIIRPLSLGLTPTENALARLNNLRDVTAYKLTSAPQGVSVTPGGDVTFTVVVINRSDEDKKITVLNYPVAGLTPKAGYENFEATVGAHDTASYEYVMTVDASVAPGTLLKPLTTINGVTLTDTPVYVGKTLTAEQKAKFYDAAQPFIQQSFGRADLSSDPVAMINGIYSEVLNKTGNTLPFKNADELISALYKSVTSGASSYYVLKERAAGARSMIAPNLFGGWGYGVGANDETEIMTDFSYKNFIEGDVLFMSEDGTPEKASLWLYIGNRTFVSADGEKPVVYSGSSGCMALLDKLFGQFCYCVLRPSLGF